MNNELVMILYMMLSGGLFALGGTGGWAWESKLWRRLGVPAVTLGYLGLLWTDLISSLGSVVFLILVLHLGYGNGKSWAYRLMVAFLYAVPSLFFGWSIWFILSPLWFITLFYLSNTKAFENQVVWKAVEFIGGLGIALIYIGALRNPW
jgi:hypothetical protein